MTLMKSIKTKNPMGKVGGLGETFGGDRARSVRADGVQLEGGTEWGLGPIQYIS